MADLLRQLKHAMEAFAGKKTYAQSQMQKYKRVLDGVGEQLGRMADLEEIIRQMGTDYDYMEKNSSCASGELRTSYEDRESLNRTAVVAVESHYTTSAVRVRDRLQEAQNQYNYWSSEAKREEQEEQAHEKQYYEELARQKRQQEEYNRKRKNQTQNHGKGGVK